MKKSSMLLLCIGGAYVLVFILSLKEIIVLSPRDLFGVSIFAGCVALGDLIESVGKRYAKAYLSDHKFDESNKKVKRVKRVTDCLTVVIYFTGVIAFVVAPVFDLYDNDVNINTISNSFSILSFAVIFISVAIKDSKLVDVQKNKKVEMKDEKVDDDF